MVRHQRLPFNVGDSVLVEAVHQVGKKRCQLIEGIVISRKGAGISSTFTIRRVSLGFGVELVFQLFSPLVTSVTIRRSGTTRKAKLYYLRRKDLKFQRAITNVTANFPD